MTPTLSLPQPKPRPGDILTMTRDGIARDTLDGLLAPKPTIGVFVGISLCGGFIRVQRGRETGSYLAESWTTGGQP